MSVLRSTSGVGYGRGGELVREGETGKGFFVMTKGTAAVSVGGTQVDTIGPGSYFGEMAVLDGSPRTATITATGQVFILHLPPATLSRILEKYPTIARQIDERAQEASLFCRRAGRTRGPRRSGSARGPVRQAPKHPEPRSGGGAGREEPLARAQQALRSRN